MPCLDPQISDYINPLFRTAAEAYFLQQPMISPELDEKVIASRARDRDYRYQDLFLNFDGLTIERMDLYHMMLDAGVDYKDDRPHRLVYQTYCDMLGRYGIAKDTMTALIDESHVAVLPTAVT